MNEELDDSTERVKPKKMPNSHFLVVDDVPMNLDGIIEPLATSSIFVGISL